MVNLLYFTTINIIAPPSNNNLPGGRTIWSIFQQKATAPPWKHSTHMLDTVFYGITWVSDGDRHFKSPNLDQYCSPRHTCRTLWEKDSVKEWVNWEYSISDSLGRTWTRFRRPTRSSYSSCLRRFAGYHSKFGLFTSSWIFTSRTQERSRK